MNAKARMAIVVAIAIAFTAMLVSFLDLGLSVLGLWMLVKLEVLLRSEIDVFLLRL